MNSSGFMHRSARVNTPGATILAPSKCHKMLHTFFGSVFGYIPVSTCHDNFFAVNMATPAPICATQGIFTRLFESKIACI
jgi:hypothetical protein